MQYIELYAIVGAACPKEQKARECLPTSKSTKSSWRGHSTPRFEAGLRDHEHGGILPSVSRSCLDNAATEQVFGHLKDELFCGGQWPDFANFKRDLEAYVVH